MKRYLLAATILAAAGATPAWAKCATAPGSGTGVGEVQFYTGDCSSDNQANDGDDGKAFIDKGSAPTGSTSIDLSLDKNSSLLDDQNFLAKSLTAGGTFSAFTSGNGFANIKSDNDLAQKFEFDPLLPSDYLSETKFLGFDGMLFRGQEVDLPGAAKVKGPDTGSITILVNLSDGSSVTDTITGIKLKADFGVLGFDEPAKMAGVFVDSVTVSTDANHAFDQLKQIEFSVPGVSSIPEPSTWLMALTGFGLLGSLGMIKRKARYAI
jgi:hypothetical protein